MARQVLLILTNHMKLIIGNAINKDINLLPASECSEKPTDSDQHTNSIICLSINLAL